MGTLLIKYIVMVNPTTYLLLATQVGYILFEIGICTIQAWIFFLLITLYRDDHPNW